MTPSPSLLPTEIDFLYQTSQQLVIATTPAEILEAVSPYARANGAAAGDLWYFDDFQPYWAEIVATWEVAEVHRKPMGMRLALNNRRLSQATFANPTRPTFISDIFASDIAEDDDQLLGKTYQLRALVTLPLYSNGRWIAMITFDWKDVQAFNERDERVYSALQQYAASAVATARLFKQTLDRAVELEVAKREIDILYEFSSQLLASSTPDAVLNAVSGYARDNGASSGHLFYANETDKGWIELAAEWSLIERQEMGVGWRLPVPDRSLHDRWLSHPEQPTLIADVMNSDRVSSDSRAMLQQFAVRAFVALPLNSKGRWLGVIYFLWDSPHTFDARDQRIFTALQSQASPVLDAIRLLEQTRRRAVELESANQEIDLLYRVGKSINAANTYQELVHALTGIISGEITVGLYFWENWDYETASHVELAAGTGTVMARIGQQIPRSALAYTETLSHESMVVIESVETNPRLDPETVARYVERGLHAVISIRLYIGDRWIGELTFQSSTPRQFSTQERRLVSGVGDYIRGAVERVRLQQETEAARRAAEQLAAQAQQLAAFEERNRLARELHDSVSQVLYSISLWGHSARAYLKHDPSKIGESVSYILSLAEVGLSEMRTLIFELRPESLEEEGLISALTKQADSIRARHGIEVTTEFCAEPPLPLSAKSDLYRIAREALHNAIKHAQASRIVLSFLEQNPGYRLEIRDNGHGFDASQTFPGHLGLKSMRERAAALNGSLEIESAVGAGTRITLIFVS